ncbi:MAG: hypothetical protein ACYTHJ_19795 [Planctomycetota bacterium]
MHKSFRILVSAGGILLIAAGAIWAARATANMPWTWSLPLALMEALVFILVLGSLYEWIVHRYIYHGPSRFKLLNDIYLIHEKGHHWHRFPPTHYVEPGPVERIPVMPAAPMGVCRSAVRRFIAWLGQYLLYLTVAIPFAFAPAWLISHNGMFAIASIVFGLVVCYFFIRVHDVMHYPGLSPWMEKTAWFKFLDRHHYIHHIDNRANLNFLLPLFDWLAGTMRTRMSEQEQATWPSFETSKRLHQQENHIQDRQPATP